MSVVRKMTCLVAGLGAVALVYGAHVEAAESEFDGSKFTCLQYTNGLGENSAGKMQSNLARLWIQGYLAGYAKAQGKLEFSAEQSDETNFLNVMLSRCREFPQNAILTVSMQSLAPDVKKLPQSTGTDFTPVNYSCAQHADAKGGAAADAVKADLAEMWAFAFIQGFKNVGAPNMEIPLENKGALVGAVTKNCANMRDLPFMDLTALVAEKVKLN
jgi:hypothetical protein